jgi:hypothetical protein
MADADSNQEKEKKSSADLVEEQIQAAMDEGRFDNLPGYGKPFNFADESFVPESYRLAYRIMRENDIPPEWITLQKELVETYGQARAALQKAAAQYYRQMARAGDSQSLENVILRLRARDERDQAQNEFRAHLAQLNRKVARYNLKVPSSSLTRDLYDPEREIQRLFPPESST